MMKREFNVILERDADGYFVASVPNFHNIVMSAITRYDFQNALMRLLCFTNTFTAKKSRVFTPVLY